MMATLAFNELTLGESGCPFNSGRKLVLGNPNSK